MKARFGLFDSCFPGYASMSVADDTAAHSPSYINWARSEYLPVTFYTDQRIPEVIKAPSIVKKAFAILIEPRCFNPKLYATAHEFSDCFEAIFTFDMQFIRECPWAKYYPFGGARVENHDTKIAYQKNRLVSIMTTDKDKTEGHRLRHVFTEQALNDGRVDAYGRGYKPIQSKRTALEDYMFTIVVESCDIDDYFTEKLIDPMLFFTIPIYWGTKNVFRIFNRNGIIPVPKDTSIEEVVNMLTPDLYIKMRDFAFMNYSIANRFLIAEDWLYKTYRGILL